MGFYAQCIVIFAFHHFLTSKRKKVYKRTSNVQTVSTHLRGALKWINSSTDLHLATKWPLYNIYNYDLAVSIWAKLNYSIPSLLSKTVYYYTPEILKSLKKQSLILISYLMQFKVKIVAACRAAVFNLQIIRCSKTAMFKE